MEEDKLKESTESLENYISNLEEEIIFMKRHIYRLDENNKDKDKENDILKSTIKTLENQMRDMRNETKQS